ncbi:MAG: hypothetical protein AAF412_10170 [Pseudomonadota bacterium]
MIFAPKIASILDVMINRELRRCFGGLLRVASGAVIEIAFSMMLAPIMAIANTIFLFKLFVLGKPKAWVAQSRKSQSLPFVPTFAKLWPQMIFGFLGFSLIFSSESLHWFTLVMCVPVFVGPLFALPFALSSSHPGIGQIAARFGLWLLPEEQKTPAILQSLKLPALSDAVADHDNGNDPTPLAAKDLLEIRAE